MYRTLCISLALLFCLTGLAETFLVTSDLHLTGDGEAHQAALEALRAASAHVDALLLLGDSTNNAHDEEHAQVLEFLSSIDVPCYIIPGNHDVTLKISDFIDLYADYGWNSAFARYSASGSCAVLTDGGTCLLLLDTNDMPGHVAPLGGIDPSTCAWVKETLSALPPGTPVVACGHHPIIPEERWTRTPGAEALSKVLDGVGLYLCGHDHGFAAVKLDGLQQITVGQPHAYPGWAGLLEVKDSDFHWQVIPLYDEPTQQDMKASVMALAEGMGRGTLAGTKYEADDEAVEWFADAFEKVMSSELTNAECERLLNAPAAQKWREIETKTVVKKWIFGLLEHCPQDVREIEVFPGRE